MTLTLTALTSPPARVDLSPLVPETTRGRSAIEVAGTAIRCGRDRVGVGELFAVSGYGTDELVLRGELGRIDRIGAGMRGGRLRVEGSCGDHVGARMTGGEIVIDGDAGAFAGAELRGGLVRIEGSAGASAGAGYPGTRAGMSGGEIVIAGDAGQEAGAAMRRGLVAIGGRAGDGAGLRMLAGTVIALRGVGAEAGMGNKRGSIVSGRPLRPLPGYARAVRYRPPALALQLRRLRELGLEVPDAMLTGAWTRWAGDRLELSRGEILIFDEEEVAAG
ncbi:MAG: formylmethanofuran dehydrogenase subunit C [Solirubrobacterales bacterium]|nr:formylmethanofuran dehydrogenase subunit C [Solirubrobacterales bacterium]